MDEVLVEESGLSNGALLLKNGHFKPFILTIAACFFKEIFSFFFFLSSYMHLKDPDGFSFNVPFHHTTQYSLHGI